MRGLVSIPMPDHHLIRAVERGGWCIYCDKKLDDTAWKSSFTPGSHYKCIVCSCGKTNCMEVFYIGTGHDGMSGLEQKISGKGRIIPLENTTKILR
jgi:hypothetical protein